VRRPLTIVGAICAGLGFLATLGALALPWATYRVRAQTPLGTVPFDQTGRVSLFTLPHGRWYLMLLLATCVAFAAAVGGEGWLHRAGALVGVLFGLAGCVYGVTLAGEVGQAFGDATFGAVVAVSTSTRTGPAIPFGIAAPFLVGLSSALLGAARGQPDQAGSRTWAADTTP
jgi:hypothetical protein